MCLLKEWEEHFACNTIFVAKDAAGIIKKINLFMRGNLLDIVNYLDTILQVKHGQMKSNKNNQAEKIYYLWHTKNDTAFSLADLSDLYGYELFFLEIMSNKSTDAVLKYTVIKTPAFFKGN